MYSKAACHAGPRLLFIVAITLEQRHHSPLLCSEVGYMQAFLVALFRIVEIAITDFIGMVGSLLATIAILSSE